MPSRIGDTPIVGSGTYADNNIGGLSATGTGEVIMKSVLAFDILKRVQYIPAKSLQQHAQEACDEMKAFYEDDGGVVGLDKNGNMAAAFSSDQMSWAFQNNAQNIKYGINPDETFEYDIEACKNRNCVLGV
jgi:beta-aspartyl-peptidase (threonine type)